jgi:hypothetical protein
MTAMGDITRFKKNDCLIRNCHFLIVYNYNNKSLKNKRYISRPNVKINVRASGLMLVGSTVMMLKHVILSV